MKPSEAEEYMGLESGAYDKRQLEQRFRKLSIKLHPDKNVGAEDSTEQFQRLGTAFDTLQRHLRGDGTVRDSDDDASWSDDEDEGSDEGSEDVSRGGGGDGGGVPEDIMEMLYRMGVFRDDGDGASRQAFLRFREAYEAREREEAEKAEKAERRNEQERAAARAARRAAARDEALQRQARAAYYEKGGAHFAALGVAPLSEVLQEMRRRGLSTKGFGAAAAGQHRGGNGAGCFRSSQMVLLCGTRRTLSRGGPSADLGVAPRRSSRVLVDAPL